MPRYFFSFQNADSCADDLVGYDLPDELAARAQARKLAADLATGDALEGRLPKYEWVEVADELLRPVARLRVADAAHEPNRLR